MNNEDLSPTAAPPVEPSAQAVTNFWAFARDHVGWATVEGLFGQQQASTMLPPWMHLSGDALEATARADDLIRESTLVVSEPVAVYAQGELPQRGDLAIVVDGGGRPVALAATLEVSVVPGGALTSATDEDGDLAGKIVTETLRCLYPESH